MFQAQQTPSLSFSRNNEDDAAQRGRTEQCSVQTGGRAQALLNLVENGKEFEFYS